MAFPEDTRRLLQNAADTIKTRSPVAALDFGPFLIRLQEECMKVANMPRLPNHLVATKSQESTMPVVRSTESQQEGQGEKLPEDPVLERPASTTTIKNQFSEKEITKTGATSSEHLSKELHGLVRDIGYG